MILGDNQIISDDGTKISVIEKKRDDVQREV